MQTPDRKMLFTDTSGNPVTRYDFRTGTGGLKWFISGPVPAKEICDQWETARRVAQSGDLHSAAELFQSVAFQAADWPDAYFDLAYTYLLLGDADSAFGFYMRTDSLVPDGFFSTKTAIYTLLLEKDGQLPHGFYRTFAEIEDSDPARKRSFFSQLVLDYPWYPPSYAQLLSVGDSDAEKLETIGKALLLALDRDSKGKLYLEWALVNIRGNKGVQAKELLAKILTDDEFTFYYKELSRFVVASMGY